MTDCEWLRHELGSARWQSRYAARQARTRRVSRLVATVLHPRGGPARSGGHRRPEGDAAGLR